MNYKQPKHTPGPWSIDPPRTANEPKLTVFLGADDNAGWATLVGRDRDANAKLIATAPELLALVQRYAGMHKRATGATGGGGYCGCKVCDDTRALLAKAAL